MKISVIKRKISAVLTALMMFSIIMPAISLYGTTAFMSAAADKVYNALCIEPVYDTNALDNDAKHAKKIIEKNISGASVNVDTMTSSKFNCINADILEKYDYIYVGACDSYKHVGDIVQMSNNLFNSDEADFFADRIYFSWIYQKLSYAKIMTAYSGNDFSAKSVEALKKYYDAGYPLELDTSNSENKWGSYDGKKLTESTRTNAAELRAYVKGKSGNINSGLESRIQNVKQLRLDISLTEPDAGTDGYLKSKNINYTFEINGTSGKTYTMSYLTDNNFDGRFDENSEMMSNLGITLASNKNRAVEADKLQSGVKYVLTINLTDYVGLFSWQMKVSENSSSRYTVKEGAYKLHLSEGQDKIDINVLQLISNNNTKVYLPETEEMDWMMSSSGGISLSNVVENYKNTSFKSYKYGNTSITGTKVQVMYRFAEYIKNLNEYDIHITRINPNDASAMSNIISGYTGSGSSSEMTSVYNYMNQYDMLILGFADCYADLNDSFCKALDRIITVDGKSVLFTHDTSSMVNMTNNERDKVGGIEVTNWGYNINRYFRDMLGMDRFGAAANSTSEGKDYCNTTADSSLFNGNVNSNNIYTKVNQGYTTSVLDRYKLINGSCTKGNDYTTSASMVNSGPITTYPYKISENLTVSTTHSQYYQLDLEDDDIVVWYALSGSNFYNQYPGDGRNNYYIYSKGNIIYSGVGHSEMDPYSNTNEMQLFVNTMVASYRAAESTVQIQVTNWDESSDSAGNSVLNVDFTKPADGSAFGDGVVKNNGQQYKKVLFKVYDRSVAARKTMSVEFYKVDAVPTGGAEPVESQLSYFMNSIYRSSDGKKVAGNSLQSGTEYYIYVPLASYSNRKTVAEINVKMTYTPSGTGGTDTVVRSYRHYVTLNYSLWSNLG